MLLNYIALMKFILIPIIAMEKVEPGPIPMGNYIPEAPKEEMFVKY